MNNAQPESAMDSTLWPTAIHSLNWFDTAVVCLSTLLILGSIIFYFSKPSRRQNALWRISVYVKLNCLTAAMLLLFGVTRVIDAFFINMRCNTDERIVYDMFLENTQETCFVPLYLISISWIGYVFKIMATANGK
jgi:hypothetical protein